MAKGSGNTRCSSHGGNPYHVNGVRKEYWELPQSQQRTVQSLMKTYSKGMRDNLREKTVMMKSDGKEIQVGFNREGCDHLVRDAMMKLSGKYFSKNSLYNFDRILEKAVELPSSHALYKERHDGKTKFFKYTDNEGRGVIIKVAYNPTAGDKKRYFPYSLDDKKRLGPPLPHSERREAERGIATAGSTSFEASGSEIHYLTR